MDLGDTGNERVYVGEKRIDKRNARDESHEKAPTKRISRDNNQEDAEDGAHDDTRGDYAPHPHSRRFSTELTSCSDRPVA